jgi:hypothetical protein
MLRSCEIGQARLPFREDATLRSQCNEVDGLSSNDGMLMIGSTQTTLISLVHRPRKCRVASTANTISAYQTRMSNLHIAIIGVESSLTLMKLIFRRRFATPLPNSQTGSPLRTSRNQSSAPCSCLSEAARMSRRLQWQPSNRTCKTTGCSRRLSHKRMRFSQTSTPVPARLSNTRTLHTFHLLDSRLAGELTQ